MNKHQHEAFNAWLETQPQATRAHICMNVEIAHLIWDAASGKDAQDAARYRFLRESESFAVFIPQQHGHIAFMGDGLDTKIDAMREKGGA